MDGDYDRRAGEYDDWWLRAGRHADDPDADLWHAEVAQLVDVLGSLPARTTLDVACGTGFLTRHLPGEVTGLDRSEAMLEQARAQAPRVRLVQGDALVLPFADGAFERVFTSFFYGHLAGAERDRFVAEARRVGTELLVVEGARSTAREDDGSAGKVPRHDFDPADLVAELGGRVVHAGRRIVVVAA